VDVLSRAAAAAGTVPPPGGASAPDPWASGLPPDIEQRLTARYRDLFTLFVKHREHIARVSTWGTHDGESWKNNFPVPGRTNYPLLFDRELQRKQAYQAVATLPR
jgi:endo-1,4-beta-xylanase